MKITQKAGGMEKIKGNNHKIKEVKRHKYLGSKIVTNGSLEDITQRIKMQGSFSS
jgi:hypothetical protein